MNYTLILLIIAFVAFAIYKISLHRKARKQIDLDLIERYQSDLRFNEHKLRKMGITFQQIENTTNLMAQGADFGNFFPDKDTKKLRALIEERVKLEGILKDISELNDY